MDEWEKVISIENLYQAYKNAAKGKRSNPDVANFIFNLEENLFNLQEELEKNQYTPGSYHYFYIHEPKKRLIAAAPFRDRVVHHALCAIIQPKLERKMIYHSYANRIGKGTYKALDQCTKYLRSFNYVLPIDIVQFFPSIDHQILFSKLSSEINSSSTLNLINQILESNNAADLTGKGLPIGNLTSQLWANYYLSSLDHFIKQQLKCKGYIRYVDDMLLFSDDKRELLGWKQEIFNYLKDLKLQAHETKAHSRPTEMGIPFLGFQIFKTHRKLKSRKVIYFKRKIKAKYKQYLENEISKEELNSIIIGWINHARYGDT